MHESNEIAFEMGIGGGRSETEMKNQMKWVF